MLMQRPPSLKTTPHLVLRGITEVRVRVGARRLGLGPGVRLGLALYDHLSHYGARILFPLPVREGDRQAILTHKQ